LTTLGIGVRTHDVAPSGPLRCPKCALGGSAFVPISLTVLGCAGTYTGVGRACSGYLVEAAERRLLLDAGNGSTANLQRLLPVRDLDAIVISHRHVDHCADLISCFYNLRFDPERRGVRLPLYAAAEVHGLLSELLCNDSPMHFDDVYDHHEVGHGDVVEIGELRLRFARSVHPVPTVSTRIELDGRVLVYSGDSAGGPDLVEIARGADLFLCEATWTGGSAGRPPGIHLTAGEAGAVAEESGVGRLLLTHLAGATDRDLALREARATFGGPVELAEDLASHTI
jgi:ribonuclease BN (tRNA processing enzyme)